MSMFSFFKSFKTLKFNLFHVNLNVSKKKEKYVSFFSIYTTKKGQNNV
jgi:hypothetical protein